MSFENHNEALRPDTLLGDMKCAFNQLLSYPSLTALSFRLRVNRVVPISPQPGGGYAQNQGLQAPQQEGCIPM